MKIFEDIREVGHFTMTSGRTSNYFYNFDRLFPYQVTLYAEQLVDAYLLYQKNIPCVITPAYGGVPLAFAIANLLRVPLLTLTKEGIMRGRTEYIHDGYLIVDDVISTYGAIKNIQRHIDPKYKPYGAAAFIFRGKEEKMKTM
ncbi:MAG: hypothetical protein ACE5KG_05115, partial [Nitrososphaerales archaeon]